MKPNYPYHHAAAMLNHYDFLKEFVKTKQQKEVVEKGWNYWMEELKAHKNLKQ